MTRILMHIISTIFHPTLLPTFLVLLPYWCIPTVAYELHLPLVLIIILSYTIIPMILLWFLYLLKVIGSLNMKNLLDRRISLATTSGWCAISSWMLQSRLDIPYLLMAMLWSITLTMGWLLIGNLKMRVSLHANNIAILVGYLLVAYQLTPTPLLLGVLALSIVVLGLVMSSRIYLKAHRSIETYIGATLGVAGAYGLGLWVTW